MPKTTYSRRVANELGGYGIYVDRLKDGSRSLKVESWSLSDYQTAAARLTELGCEVQIQEFTSYLHYPWGCVVDQIRLWVKEPQAT